MPSNAGEVRVKLALDVTDLKSQLRDAENEIKGGQGIKVPLSFSVSASEANDLATDLQTRMGTRDRKIPVKFKIDSDSIKDVQRQFNRIKPTVKVDAELRLTPTGLQRKFNSYLQDNVNLRALKVPVEFVSGHRSRAASSAVKVAFGEPKPVVTSKAAANAAAAAAAKGVENRERGGPVQPNRPYVVGEKGPELFMPTGAGGRIIPARHPGGFVHEHPHPAGMYPRAQEDPAVRARIEAGQRAKLAPGYAPTPSMRPERAAGPMRPKWEENRDVGPRLDAFEPEAGIHRARQQRIGRLGDIGRPIKMLPKQRVLRRGPADINENVPVVLGTRDSEGYEEYLVERAGNEPEWMPVARYKNMAGIYPKGARIRRRGRVPGGVSSGELSFGSPETEIDEAMDVSTGRTASTRSPRRRQRPMVHRPKKRGATEQAFRDSLTKERVARFWESIRGKRMAEELDPTHEGPGYSFRDAGPVEQKKGPFAGYLNLPEKGYRHPVYDRSDPTRGAFDEWTGPGSESVVEGGDFVSAEVQFERDVQAYRDEKAAERRAGRERLNQYRGAQNKAAYQELEDTREALAYAQERSDPTRVALKNLFTLTDNWVYDQEIKRLMKSPNYSGPKLELRGTQSPWQYAAQTPALREFSRKREADAGERAIRRSSEGVEESVSVSSGERFSEMGFAQMLRTLLESTAEQGLTEDRMKQLSGLVTGSKESIPGLLLGQAVAEEAGDAAWKRLPAAARRRESQIDASKYELLVEEVETQRRKLNKELKTNPLAHGKRREFLQRVKQGTASEGQFMIAEEDLKTRQDALRDATKRMNKFMRKRRPGKESFKAFRNAMNYKRDLRRQAVDESGEYAFDEAGAPILEDSTYLASTLVPITGGVRSTSRDIYTDAKLEQLDESIAGLEADIEGDRRALKIKRGSDEYHAWLKQDPKRRSTKRAAFMTERSDLRAYRAKKADRAMGGPIGKAAGWASHDLTWGAHTNTPLGRDLRAAGIRPTRAAWIIEQQRKQQKAGLAGTSFSDLAPAEQALVAKHRKMPQMFVGGALAGLGLGARALGKGIQLGAAALMPLTRVAVPGGIGRVTSSLPDIPLPNIGAGMIGGDPSVTPSGLVHSPYAAGGMLAARQAAPHHASGKLPPLAAAPGAVLVGERGPEGFVAAARGMMVGQHGPEVIVPAANGVITPNHWDGDPDQIPGQEAPGFLRRNLPWVAAAGTMGAFNVAGMHAGGPVSVAGRQYTPPGGGAGPHAHGDAMKMYGYFENGEWQWVDLQQAGTPALDAAAIHGRGGSHRGGTMVHGGSMPKGYTGTPPMAAGPITHQPPGQQAPAFRRASLTAPMASAVSTRGAPSVAAPIAQASFIQAQEEMRDLQQRIEAVRIQSSDALQLTPVRALSVSMGQQFQERFGGRRQIRQRESLARQRANDAGRVANRLSSQVAKADEREDQVRRLGARNRLVLERGGSLTDEQRDELRLAQMEKREARRGADTLREPAERMALRAEILERGEKTLIQQVRANASAMPGSQRVFTGNEEKYDPTTGRVTVTPQYMQREAMVRQEAAKIRQEQSARGGENIDPTGGILQRGNVLRAQGMGLVGIVGGTMLFTRAVQTSATAFELLGKALDPLIDSWTNFTTTTNRAAEELSKAVQSAGSRGGVARALADAGIDVSSMPGLEQRAVMTAGSRQLSQFRDLTRAEMNIQGRSNENLSGLTSGLNNGIFSGVPLVGDALGWVGQDQSFAELAAGLVGNVPAVGSTPGIGLAPGVEIPGWLVKTFEDVNRQSLTGDEDTLADHLHGLFGEQTMFGQNIKAGLSAVGVEPGGYVEGDTITQEERDRLWDEAVTRNDKLWDHVNDGLEKVNPAIGEFTTGFEGGAAAVEATAAAVEEMGGEHAPQLAKMVRDFGVSLEVEGGKLPETIKDVFGNVVGGEMVEALDAAMEGMSMKSFDSLFDSMQKSLEANIRGMQRRMQYQLQTDIPRQQYLNVQQNPLMPAGFGVSQDPRFAGISGPSRARSEGILDELNAPGGMIAQGRQRTFETIMNARGFEGPPNILEDGVSGMVDWVKASAEVAANMAQIESLTEQIQQLDIADATAMQAQNQAQYNEQLRLSVRNAGNLLGQAGQLSGTYGQITSYNEDGEATIEGQVVQATKLGKLMRSQMMDQRELARIGLARSQRELNMSLAVARLRSPGETAAERAVRRREAEAIAKEQQEMLDINKRSTGRGFVIQDIQLSQGAEDALKALGLAEGGRALQIQIEGHEDVRRNLRVARNMKTAVQNAWISLGTNLQTLVMDTQTQLESASKTFRNAFQKETEQIFTIIQDNVNETLGGNFEISWDDEEKKTKSDKKSDKGDNDFGFGKGQKYEPGYATGGIMNTAGATSFIAGEAGMESVVVIRNPKMGSMSGGGKGSVNININASVRNDGDVDALVRKVVREIHSQSELVV